MAFSTQPSLLRRPTLLSCAVPGFIAASITSLVIAAPEPGEGVRLAWRNGDVLSGNLLESSEGRIKFEAAPFVGPLDLKLGQLEGIRFPPLPNIKEKSPEGLRFEVSLRNGDRLEGKLLAMGRESLILECAPLLGPIEIKRAAVTRISRTKGEQLSFSGLGELTEWTSTGRDRKPTDWFTDLRGELATHQWSGNLYRKIAFPEKVEIHFRAEFPLGSPNLEVGLLRNAQEGPMLETWDNFLVLTYRSRFVPVMELTGATKELDLRLFWNQATGEVRLCGPSGSELASLNGAKPDAPDAEKRRTSDPLDRGFSILNRSPGIKLLYLTVREWDGRPVAVIDLSQPRLHLLNSPTRFQIDDVTLSKDASSLLVGGKTVPLGDLLEMTSSPEAGDGTSPAIATATRIAWHSGTTLSGSFLQIGPNELRIAPPWSANPVTATLVNTREIRFPENAEPLEVANDILSAVDASLRGTMRLALPGDAGGSLLAWQPPGATAAVTLDNKTKTSITRSPPANDETGRQVTLSQARVYLNNDEILTGRLISVSPEKVIFDSLLTGRLEIPASRIRALDTGTAGRVLEGFKDPEWEEIEEIEESVVLTADTATMNTGGFGNPSILLGDRIHFEAEWKKSFGSMTLRLFTAGPDNSTPSTDVIIAAQGNRIFIGKLNESGAFSFSGDQIPIVNNRAVIDIEAGPEKIEIKINGKPSLNLTVDPERVSGNGLYFKMGGGWQGWNQEETTIEISHFRIESSPGSIPRRVIDKRAKEHILSIPRVLREDIPTHLLIAPNGDLLRGKLESANEESLNFTAREETIEVSGNRVSTIVWLRPPRETPKTEEKPEAPAKMPEPDPVGKGAGINPSADDHHKDLEISNFHISHQFVLRDGTRLQLIGDRVEGNRLIGTSSILGRCSLSIENIREVRSGPPVPIHKAERMDLIAFDDWQAALTPDPAIPDGDGKPASPLIGKPAPPVELTRVDDSVFKLGDHLGKVVVLDFWATWCGPCIKAMPDVMDVVAAFPGEKVAFCAVNQAETTPIVSAFIENRKWQNLPVALDFDMKVSRSYQVESIPHTVVIDPEGRIAWVHSGYSPELKRELFEAIATILSQ